MTSTTPQPTPEADPDADGELLDSADQAELDMLCERWVYWSRTRRQYAPSASLAGVLGKLTKSTRPLPAVPFDPIASAELFALNLAYRSQPQAIDRQVFEAHYLYRIKPIKVAADALGISRAHYYTLLRSFRQRVHIVSKVILNENLRAGAALPHAPRQIHTGSPTE